MNAAETETPAFPGIQHQRLEPVRRRLTVTRVQAVTPRMMRVTMEGEALASFVSPSPDDHIKVFFPLPDGGEAKRDFTPRRFDVKACTLAIDFALHEGGVGSAWAQEAKPGDVCQIGGPRGSTVISAPGAWWLLIGDGTALPSVSRRLEEMAPGTRALTLVAVAGKQEEQIFETQAEVSAVWVHRPETQAADPAPFLEALSAMELPAGPGFIWIGAESEVARALRTYFIESRGHSPEWIKASSYWSQTPERQ